MDNLIFTGAKVRAFHPAFRSVLLTLTIASSALVAQVPGDDELIKQIRSALGKNDGFFALAFKDAASGREILINEREPFHAASTMKMPVMIEVFKQVNEKRLSLTDSIVLKNEFTSIVDGSPYSLSRSDDSEQGLYELIGQKRPLSSVMHQMIIASSNLATNIIIDLVGAQNVTQTIRELGARDMVVLRGVEDSKAFAKGLNNTITAYDLMILFDKMAKGEIINPFASEQMIAILRDQRYNEIIPALLPAGVSVAHKTGWITGVQHDAGIVILPKGARYTLVLLSKKLTNEKAAVNSMAQVSRMIYDYVNRSTDR